MKLYKKIIAEGLMVAGLTGLFACDDNEPKIEITKVEPNVAITKAEPRIEISKTVKKTDPYSANPSFVASFPVGKEEPVAIDAGDYDNDGDIDLIVVSSRRYSAYLHILENRGDGSFDRRLIGTIKVEPESNLAITGSDFNGDGFRDFILSKNYHRSNDLFMYKNDGAGNFR